MRQFLLHGVGTLPFPKPWQLCPRLLTQRAPWNCGERPAEDRTSSSSSLFSCMPPNESSIERYVDMLK